MSVSDKTSLAYFARNWRITGPRLEEIRLREVAALEPQKARRQTLSLLALWKPGFNRPLSGLVQQQIAFRQLERFRKAQRP